MIELGNEGLSFHEASSVSVSCNSSGSMPSSPTKASFGLFRTRSSVGVNGDIGILAMLMPRS